MANITTKQQLALYIKADYMMNRGYFKPSFLKRLVEWFYPDYIMDYLVALRKYSYYINNRSTINLPFYVYWKLKYRRLGIKLGFSIEPNVLGYGLSIPHYGTIVVGAPNEIGNYAVLHTCTVITGNGKTIGDALYLGTGAKITPPIVLGNGVSVAANSVVLKNCEQDNVLLVGMPASIKGVRSRWYECDGRFYEERYDKVEKIKIRK